MRCRRVIFTGDFLRPSWDGRRPTQHYNIQWCRDLLSAQIRAATELPIEMLAWNAGGVVSGQLDDCSIRNFYNILGLPRTIEAWASVYEENAFPDVAEIFILEQLREALVIAFELPPYIEHILRRHGIPFIDIIVHPVRFLDDIFFAIRSSNVASNEIIAKSAIAEEFIFTIAGLQSASARRLFDFSPPDNSALLLLQTRYDRTQIKDGAFIGATACLDNIRELAKTSTSLFVKEHPLDLNNRHATAVLSEFRNAELTSNNVYKLFATDSIRTVLSLSSSAGIEAKYFGKDSFFLYKKPNDFALDGACPKQHEFVGVFDAFLNPDFWRKVLEPIVRTTSLSGQTVPFKPNRLRISLQSFWKFNEIDSDIYSKTISEEVKPKTVIVKPKSDTTIPVAARPNTITFPKDLLTSLRLGATALRRDNNIIDISAGKSGHAIYGPYLSLESGSYRVALTLKTDAATNIFARAGRIVIDIAADNGGKILAERHLTTSLIKKSSGEQELDFVLSDPGHSGDVELRVWTDGRYGISLHKAKLIKM